MTIFNEKQKENIRKLQPFYDSNFSYNPKTWNKLNPEFKSLINDFENKEISRRDVIEAYQSYFLNNNLGVMKAFLLTMVWGFADAGYGAYRTNLYISTEENILRIRKALDFINSDDPDCLKKAFNELKKIKGLGISYLTKILYFATRAKNIDDYALIFDIRVATSLVKLTIPKEIFDIVNIGPSTKFEDYQNYNSLIHKLATDNQVEADQLEMYLFEQKFE